MKVVKFEPRKEPEPEPDPVLISALEEMLGRAKSGEMIALHAVEQCRNEGPWYWNSGDFDPFYTVYLLKRLGQEVLDEAEGYRDEDE